MHPSSAVARFRAVLSSWAKGLRFLPLLACLACATPAEYESTLVVASDLDNLPFAGVDQQGKAIGRDVEMMEMLAAKLRMGLRWERKPFDELIPAVEAGTVDAACATLGITPERAQRLAFSQPYFRTAIIVVVRIGPGEPQTLTDLRGRRVAGGQGTTSADAVRRYLPAAIPVTNNPKTSPTAERLLSGEIDAAAMDEPAGADMVAASGGKLRLLAIPLVNEDYGIAVPLGREDLLNKLNQALSELQASGAMRELNRKHRLARIIHEDLRQGVGQPGHSQTPSNL